MKKPLIAILILSSCVWCQAAMWFMHFSPSAINQAMGSGYVGVADVWHSSPLIAVDNPAMPALHEGIAYGYVQDRFLEGAPGTNWYRYSGMLSMGYQGIGILLPAVNPYGNFGTFFDYGGMNTTSEEEFGAGYRYHAYESTRSYGISFNPFEYKRSRDAQFATQYAGLDASVGLTYSRVYSNVFASLQPPSDWECKENILELGLLAHGKQPLASWLVLEGSLGFHKYNLTNAVVEYTDSLGTTPWGQNNVYGAGMAVSLPLAAAIGTNPLSDWVENLFTVRALADKNVSHDFGCSTSTGMELGMLDSIYLRWGYCDENAGDWSGSTRGIGLSLHRRGVGSIEANYAEFPNAHWPGDQHGWDVMLQIDGQLLFDSLHL